MNVIEYLKDRRETAMENVALCTRKIREEEEKTKRHDIRVVVETRADGGSEYRRTIIAEQFLTLEQRDRMIGNLAWLRRV